jgi:Sec-independent protein translocase protein TatA
MVPPATTLWQNISAKERILLKSQVAFPNMYDPSDEGAETFLQWLSDWIDAAHVHGLSFLSATLLLPSKLPNNARDAVTAVIRTRSATDTDQQMWCRVLEELRESHTPTTADKYSAIDAIGNMRQTPEESFDDFIKRFDHICDTVHGGVDEGLRIHLFLGMIPHDLHEKYLVAHSGFQTQQWIHVKSSLRQLANITVQGVGRRLDDFIKRSDYASIEQLLSEHPSFSFDDAIGQVAFSNLKLLYDIDGDDRYPTAATFLKKLKRSRQYVNDPYTFDPRKSMRSSITQRSPSSGAASVSYSTPSPHSSDFVGMDGSQKYFEGDRAYDLHTGAEVSSAEVAHVRALQSGQRRSFANPLSIGSTPSPSPLGSHFNGGNGNGGNNGSAATYFNALGSVTRAVADPLTDIATSLLK